VAVRFGLNYSTNEFVWTQQEFLSVDALAVLVIVNGSCFIVYRTVFPDNPISLGFFQFRFRPQISGEGAGFQLRHAINGLF